MKATITNYLASNLRRFQLARSLCAGQSLCNVNGGRSYASHPAAHEAEQASLPRAVKERREPRKHPRLKGYNLQPLQSNPSMGMQAETSVQGRERKLRGIVDGEIVGQRIYLPNVIFKLVRNGTAEGEAYNPFKATFHVPVSTTKEDIKSYLLAVYGVETTFINTEIPHQKQPDRRRRADQAPKPRFKRAIVGLVEPFYYPDAPEDMSTEEREIYEREMAGRSAGLENDMKNLTAQFIPNPRGTLNKREFNREKYARIGKEKKARWAAAEALVEQREGATNVPSSSS